jgi:hypothetical protein
MGVGVLECLAAAKVLVGKFALLGTAFFSQVDAARVELASLDASHHCVGMYFVEHIPNTFAGPYSVCARWRMR